MLRAIAALVLASSLSFSACAQERTQEELERTFARHTRALYGAYARAQRANPELAGRLTLEIEITPAGTVARCEVKSTDLTDTALVERLVELVEQITFEAREGAPVVILKTIEFQRPM